MVSMTPGVAPDEERYDQGSDVMTINVVLRPHTKFKRRFPKMPLLLVDESFEVCGGDDPHVELSRTVRNTKTAQVVRQAVIQFYMEGADHFGNPRRLWNARITTGHKDAAKDRDLDLACLEFSYNRAVVSGVDNLPQDWPPSVREALAELSQYRQDGDAKLRLPFGEGDSGTSKEDRYRPFGNGARTSQILELLIEQTPGRLWQPYINAATQSPLTSWEDLEDRAKRIPQGIPYPALSHFSSVETAAIKLCYGRFLEHAWESLIFRQLSGSIDVAFIVLGHDLVLACVKDKKGRTIKSPKAVLDEHMTIEIMVELLDPDWDYDSDSAIQRTISIKCSGKIASNRLQVKSDFTVLIERPPRKLFEVASEYGKSPRFIPAQLSILNIDNLVKKEVTAVDLLCDRSNPAYSKWWPMLVAEDAAQLESQNFLRDVVGCTAAQIKANIDKVVQKMVVTGKTPNPEQRKILQESGMSRAGFKVIRGPPGCGKTLQIGALAEIYARSPDTGVLLCAPSNGSTGRLYESVSKWFALSRDLDASYSPQRVYRVHLEEQYLLQVFDHQGEKNRKRNAEKNANRFMKAAEHVAREAAWYARQLDSDRRRAMNDPTVGVTAAVIEALEDDNFVVLGDLGSGHMMDVVPLFKNFIRRLEQEAFGRWALEDKKRFKLVWAIIAQHLVGTKKVVVCTLGNTTSKLMERAFHAFKHVVIIIDEASLIADPSLWNVVVNLVNPERTKEDYSSVTPIAAVVLIGDDKQGAPLIKSEAEVANPFGAQLAMSPFVRFVLSGFPVENLWEQHRMVPVLCDLPNHRGYDGKLRNARETQTRRMTPEQKRFLVQKFGYPPSNLAGKQPTSSSSAINPTTIDEEDQFLRHFLLNVPQSKCQTEPKTKSRFNTATMSVGLALFKELIVSKFLSPKDIKILTFYNAQRRRYLNALLDMAKELNLTSGELDDVVHTSDSFQGCEAKCVILDVVVDFYAGPDTMGHAGDARKVNVALTRAMNFCFLIGCLRILDMKKLAQENGGEGEVREIVLEAMARLKDKGAYKDFVTQARPEDQSCYASFSSSSSSATVNTDTDAATTTTNGNDLDLGGLQIA